MEVKRQRGKKNLRSEPPAWGQLISQCSEEKALALAENRSPVLYSGDDVRPIIMRDLKYAQEQVCASFSAESTNMSELLQWNELYGEGGSRKEKLTQLFHVEEVFIVCIKILDLVKLLLKFSRHLFSVQMRLTWWQLSSKKVLFPSLFVS